LQLLRAVPDTLDIPIPPATVSLALYVLQAVWNFVVFVRAIAVAVAVPRRRWLRAVAGGLLLLAPMWLAPAIAPHAPWWKETVGDAGSDPRYPNPASEPVIAAQQHLLDEALSNLEDERPNVTDLYFVGFAGDGREDVFRKDVEAAQKVMDDRWGTEGRSI